MAEKEAIMRALQEAMGGSTRPRSRPPGFGVDGLNNKMKKNLLQKIMGEESSTQGGKLENSLMNMSPEQIKMLEQMMMQQQRVRDSEERKAFPPASMMNGGGVAVAKKRKKSKKGCVMKGRGGSYKGMK